MIPLQPLWRARLVDKYSISCSGVSDTVSGAGDAGMRQARGEQPPTASLSVIGKIRVTGHVGAGGPADTPPPANKLTG